MDMTGKLSLALSLAVDGPDAPNQRAKYKIDAVDYGSRSGDISTGGLFTIPLDQDPMLKKLPGAKQVTVTLRGTTYVFDVAGSDQVLGNLKNCLTAPLPTGGHDSDAHNASTTSSVTTLTCTFRPARPPRDSVTCMDLGGMVDCSRPDTAGAEYSVDISFDEGQRRIINREVMAGPAFSESDIRWREPRDNKAFADYVLDRHSGAARIYVGLPKERSSSLVSVGTCQLAPERRF